MRAARTHRHPGPSRRCGVSKQHHCGWKRNSVPVQPLRAGCYRDKPVRDIDLSNQPPQTVQVEFHSESIWPQGGARGPRVVPGWHYTCRFHTMDRGLLKRK
jgi:hypothetical protein